MSSTADFESYDFSADSRWQQIEKNLEFSSDANKSSLLTKRKKKYFKQHINPDWQDELKQNDLKTKKPLKSSLKKTNSNVSAGNVSFASNNDYQSAPSYSTSSSSEHESNDQQPVTLFSHIRCIFFHTLTHIQFFLHLFCIISTLLYILTFLSTLFTHLSSSSSSSSSSLSSFYYYRVLRLTVKKPHHKPARNMSQILSNIEL